MELIFSRPIYLYLLFAIPLIIALHFVTLRARKSRALQFSNFDAIARVKGIELYSKSIASTFFVVLILLFIILSLAGTSVVSDSAVSSFSFVIAVDVSRSMEANDLPPTRLEAALATAVNFVKSLPRGTRIGIISFAGNAFIHQPVTDDQTAVIDALNGIKIAQLGGTDLAEAVITASNLLEREDAKAVILLSDGQANVGTLGDAVSYALQKNVIVHTIGIGTSKGGKTSYGFSKIDEDALAAVAYETDGEFFMAANKEEVSSSFEKIASLKVAARSLDISQELLFAALVLFIILYVYRSARSFSFP